VRDGHPRLLLDPARVAELHARLGTTHRFLWERYRQDLPRMVAVSLDPRAGNSRFKP